MFQLIKKTIEKLKIKISYHIQRGNIITDWTYLDIQTSEVDQRNARPILELAIDNISKQVVGYRVVYKKEIDKLNPEINRRPEIKARIERIFIRVKNDLNKVIEETKRKTGREILSIRKINSIIRISIRKLNNEWSKNI